MWAKAALTVVLGLLGTGIGLYMAYLHSASMWDQWTNVLGLFGGGLAGLFAAGIFTRRAGGPGMLAGFLASAAALFAVRAYTEIHFLLYAGIGAISCLVIGYLASLMLPARRRDLSGPTLYTRSRPDA